MTKEERIAEYKKQFPTLKVGSDETGYTQLDQAEYDAKITQWVTDEMAQEANAQADADAKAALLTKLGITADEAALLLG
jgi:hypothetical protein